MLFRPNPIELPGMIDLPEIGPQSPLTAPKKSKKRVEGQGELLLPIGGEPKERAPAAKERRGRQIREIDIEVMRPFRGGRSKS
jgi:hypothetical protein